MIKKICVVIPTYNEQNNISILIEKIFALHMPGIQVYIVDDNSPDGTGKIVDNVSTAYPLTVIHRKIKEGLGRAYEDAFRKILE